MKEANVWDYLSDDSEKEPTLESENTKLNRPPPTEVGHSQQALRTVIAAASPDSVSSETQPLHSRTHSTGGPAKPSNRSTLADRGGREIVSSITSPGGSPHSHTDRRSLPGNLGDIAPSSDFPPPGYIGRRPSNKETPRDRYNHNSLMAKISSVTADFNLTKALKCFEPSRSSETVGDSASQVSSSPWTSKVTRPEIRTCGLDKYVVYSVALYREDKLISSALKRYTDFTVLRNHLSTLLPGVILPLLPEKQKLGRFESAFIASRMEGLEKFLNQILSSPISNTVVVEEWFSYGSESLEKFVSSVGVTPGPAVCREELLRYYNDSEFIRNSECSSYPPNRIVDEIGAIHAFVLKQLRSFQEMQKAAASAGSLNTRLLFSLRDLNVSLQKFISFSSPNRGVPHSMLPLFLVRESLVQETAVRNTDASVSFLRLAKELEAAAQQCKGILETTDGLLRLEKEIRKEEQNIEKLQGNWDSNRTTIQSLFGWNEESSLDAISLLSKNREKLAILRDVQRISWCGFESCQLLDNWSRILQAVQSAFLLFCRGQYNHNLQVTDVWKEWARNICSAEADSSFDPNMSSEEKLGSNEKSSTSDVESSHQSSSCAIAEEA